MDRREFLGGLLAGGGALLVPASALANAKFDPLTSKLAGSVYYTKKRPGRWSRYSLAHVPVFSRRGNALQVKTQHHMRGYRHYIVKHQLFDQNFRLLGESVFDPDKDYPVSTYDITDMKGAVYATSMCNLHDTWLSGLKI